MINSAQILLTTTENYLPYVKTFIKNIIALNRYPINFYVLYSFDKTEFDVESNFKEINEIEDYNVICKYVDLELVRNLEQQPIEKINSQNLRLYLHVLNLQGKILYLDIDILVCGNFIDLFKYDLEDKTVGAVVDYNLMYRNLRTSGKYFKKKLQEPLASKELSFDGEKYINSGVLLIDLDKLNKSKLWIKNLHNLHLFTSFADQSFLNYVHYGDIEYLPIKYNYLAYHLINNRAISFNRNLFLPNYNDYIPKITQIEPVFLHFAGRQKQWNCTAREFQTAFRLFEQPLKTILEKPADYYAKYFENLFNKFSYRHLLVDPTDNSLIKLDKNELPKYRNNAKCHPLLHNYKLMGNVTFIDLWDGIFLTKLRDSFNEQYYIERNK